MTNYTNIFFNIQAISFFVILLDLDKAHTIEVHANFIWLNLSLIVLSLTVLVLSNRIMTKVRKEVKDKVAESANIC